ncbi:hypothetical protein BASA81_010793 [Batrachochytrium salamandrivorans]|nr:hypothetical protein BASA81_010793 [Batrachochytrium salamandrivorans]
MCAALVIIASVMLLMVFGIRSLSATTQRVEQAFSKTLYLQVPVQPLPHPFEPATYERPASSRFIRFSSKQEGNLTKRVEKVSPQSFGGFHSTTLTHVVVTIASMEDWFMFFNQLEEFWIGKQACGDWQQVFHGKCREVLVKPNRPFFVLQVAIGLNSTLTVPEIQLGCFQHNRAHVVYYNDSQSLIEPNTQLLMGQHCHLPGTEVGHVLFFTPQAMPIRRNWLTVLSRSVLFPVPLSWAMVPFAMDFPNVTANGQLGIFRLSLDPMHNSKLECNSLLINNTLPHLLVHDILPQLEEDQSRNQPLVSRFIFMLYNKFRQDVVNDVVRLKLAHRIIISPLLWSGGGNDTIAREAVFGTLSQPLLSSPLPLSPHKDWLSHLIFALPDLPKQVSSLNDTIKVWWEKYPPCRNAQQEYTTLQAWQTNTCPSEQFVLPPPKPTLVLMVSRRMTAEEEIGLGWRSTRSAEREIQQRMSKELIDEMNPQHQSCFAKAEICVVSLPRNLDNYLTGSRILFERMLQGKCAKGGSHALYIEPDARPIHPGWFTALSSSIVFPNPTTFVLGSLFQGQKIPSHFAVPFNLYHFNGNAVYQLPRVGRGDLIQQEEKEDGEDGELRMRDLAEYYFERAKPHVARRNRYETAMDFDLVDFVFAAWSDYGEREVTRRFSTHARYTQLISNQYHSNWNFTSVRQDHREVHMVHGGWCTEDALHCL